jgi:hypothetical protein
MMAIFHLPPINFKAFTTGLFKAFTNGREHLVMVCFCIPV